ncbi:MAG TPA: SDR family oxidoreductase [Novosphingobium sp.]|nr:SDR family oxidoreductase [Novosphingobium sp.]
MARLQGRTAIVTGAARGLGESIARDIVAEGGRVLVTDIDETLGAAVVRDLGKCARFRRLDVSQAADWAAAVAFAEAELGTPTILVANAVRMDMSRFDDIDAAEFERVWRVNELGCFLGMKAVVPAMRRAGKGAIVNIGSIASIHASGGLGYNATKFAIAGMGKAAARDLGPDNIRVNTVLPSWMIGPSTAGVDPDTVGKVLPLRRMGNTAKIAKLVSFLASDDAEFITGAEYLADGGAMLLGTYDVMGLLAGQGLGALPASALQAPE